MPAGAFAWLLAWYTTNAPAPFTTRSLKNLHPDKLVVKKDSVPAAVAATGVGSSIEQFWSVANGKKIVSPRGLACGSRLVTPVTPGPLFITGLSVTRQFAAVYIR